MKIKHCIEIQHHGITRLLNSQKHRKINLETIRIVHRPRLLNSTKHCKTNLETIRIVHRPRLLNPRCIVDFTVKMMGVVYEMYVILCVAC